ncbi:phenylalanine--tRNA ligase subunit alpha [Patescibacteria group bacterium]|nr:phenylalanine--tRNA ligase subunit alpha [Patescibacteria group bacterium]
MVKIISLKKEAQKEIKKAKDLKELDQIFKKYLGKRGKITQILRSLKKLKKETRIKIGKEANLLKKIVEENIREKAEKLKEKARAEILKKEQIDVTVPGKKVILGHLHPLTQIQRKVEEVFQSMGFSVVEGPEIETEWYNFDALNIPKDHPARDFWNTLWLKKATGDRRQETRLLLRTHTSPVQVRFMGKNPPPLRIIVPGRVFRHEATDASHEVNFYQIEGLMVDKNISVANFKAIIQKFFKKFFGKPARGPLRPRSEASEARQGRPIKIRLRPSYFPFTEPSFEVDMTCLTCRGKGCSACQRTGWMEMMGAGMVHPNVFKAVGLNPKDWQGFAFGMGLDRLAMMKYKINDIRLFYSGDLRFLNQF